MYSKETRERVFELAKEGYNPRQISEMMGGRPCHSIIQRWMGGYEPTATRRVGRLYTMEEKIAALSRLDAGEDYRELAHELGCAETTLLQWRRIRDTQGEQGLMTRIDRTLGPQQ